MQPESEGKAETHSLGSLVGALANAIENVLSPGDVAALRRLAPSDPAHPAFWKICAGWLDGELPREGPARTGMERRWAAILAGMALSAGLHDARRHAGAALAEAGYTELRFVRLLRARGDGLSDSLRQAAHFLASKAMSADWADLAWLVLSEGRSDEEDARRHLARSYYDQQHKAKED